MAGRLVALWIILAGGFVAIGAGLGYVLGGSKGALIGVGTVFVAVVALALVVAFALGRE